MKNDKNRKITIEDALRMMRGSENNNRDIQIGGTNLIRNSHNLIFLDYYFYPLSGVMLITSDGRVLKDIDGRFITVEGS